MKMEMVDGKKMDSEQEKMKVEDALQCMVKASEIVADKELLSKVTALAGSKKQAIRSIADLVARREDMASSAKKASEDSSSLDPAKEEADEEEAENE